MHIRRASGRSARTRTETSGSRQLPTTMVVFGIRKAQDARKCGSALVLEDDVFKG